MNIKDLQKHYDKLTIKERFALLVAAGARGDDQDREALLRSAPRKTWSMPNTYGLSDAFVFASMWHVMYLLSCETSFYFLMTIADDTDMDNMSIKIEGEKFSFMDALEKVQHDILRTCEAWRAVCSEYGIDGEKLTEHLPGGNMLGMLESMMKRYAADMDIEITADELEEAKADLRAVIETARKQWE